jgi:hypothetical protein
MVPKTAIYDPPLIRSLEGCVTDCVENNDKLPYIKSTDDSAFKIYWTFSSDLQSRPERFDVVRCAVDLTKKAILVLDIERSSD